MWDFPGINILLAADIRPDVGEESRKLKKRKGGQPMNVLFVGKKRMGERLRQSLSEKEPEMHLKIALTMQETDSILTGSHQGLIIISLSTMKKIGPALKQRLEALGTDIPIIYVRDDGNEIDPDALPSTGTACIISGDQISGGDVLLNFRLLKREKSPANAQGNPLRLLDTIFSSIHDGIVVSDLEGRLVRVNQGALRMYGCSEESEMLGMSAFDNIRESDRERASRNMTRTLETGMVREEYILLRKDGSEYPGELTANVIYDEAGNPTGFVAIVKDNTERKAREKELGERIRDCEALGQIVAHDLKTPLLAVMEYSRFLSEDASGKLSEEENNFLSRVIACSHDAYQMIEDLRRYYSLGQEKDGIEQVEPGQVIQQVLESLGAVSSLRDVNISIQGDIPAIAWRPTQLYHVFYNLIENAVKFGAKSIKVGYEKRNNYHRFTVKDDGWGIEEFFLGKVFDIFTRSPKVRNKRGGTGIGLAIVKRLIEGHNGRIWVDSAEGKGSAFTFEFPADLR